MKKLKLEGLFYIHTDILNSEFYKMPEAVGAFIHLVCVCNSSPELLSIDGFFIDYKQVLFSDDLSFVKKNRRGLKILEEFGYIIALYGQRHCLIQLTEKADKYFKLEL